MADRQRGRQKETKKKTKKKERKKETCGEKMRLLTEKGRNSHS